MNILIIGKQASGKTTLAYLFELVLDYQPKPITKEIDWRTPISEITADCKKSKESGTHIIYEWLSEMGKIPQGVCEQMDCVIKLEKGMSTSMIVGLMEHYKKFEK